MIPMDSAGNAIDLSQDTKRHFLYARYNVDLSPEGLSALGLGNINSDHVRQMDSVQYINDLKTVGAAAAGQVSMKHFGSFV